MTVPHSRVPRGRQVALLSLDRPLRPFQRRAPYLRSPVQGRDLGRLGSLCETTALQVEL